MAIFKVQMHKKVFFLWKRFRLDLIFTRYRTLFLVFFFLRIYFLQDFISCDLISHTILVKSPRNPKHRTFFPVTFFQRTWENSDFFPKFYFQVFFRKLFFPGLCSVCETHTSSSNNVTYPYIFLYIFKYIIFYVKIKYFDN